MLIGIGSHGSFGADLAFELSGILVCENSLIDSIVRKLGHVVGDRTSDLRDPSSWRAHVPAWLQHAGVFVA
jgi:hypothetical protein